MNVFTFKPRFEAPILAGTKHLTIRAPRRDARPRAKVGERISLRVWRGRPYASKQREFAQATVLHVIPICVSKQGVHRTDEEPRFARLCSKQVARRDGFTNWREMMAFFQGQHSLPFEGVMVVWKDLTPVSSSANLMPL